MSIESEVKKIRLHWTEEDVRALIRDELQSASFGELLHRYAVSAHAQHLASIAPTLEALPLKRAWWRKLLGGQPPWA